MAPSLLGRLVVAVQARPNMTGLGAGSKSCVATAGAGTGAGTKAGTGTGADSGALACSLVSGLRGPLFTPSCVCFEAHVRAWSVAM